MHILGDVIKGIYKSVFSPHTRQFHRQLFLLPLKLTINCCFESAIFYVKVTSLKLAKGKAKGNMDVRRIVAGPKQNWEASLVKGYFTSPKQCHTIGHYTQIDHKTYYKN